MADYDIGEAFQRVEEEMIASMSRNLKRHLATEAEEGLNYAMWQAEQLAALNNFRKNNKKLFSGYFSTINGQISDVLWRANKTGQMDQEVAILEAIKKGFKVKRRGGGISGQFFRINERKMNALIKATQKDMLRAENAMLRKADDEYRKIIYNADVYYSSGAGTLPQCVDMATKDFLSRGINCIEYRNGAIVGIDAYARMALRTTQTRARLYGEATKRDEWGINTVYVTRRGAACPKCLQWIARVYYDDVWSSLPIPEPAQYPLLSEAISGGLYHPNCKDSHTTYFEGISEEPKPLTKEEIDEANRVYKLEQRQRYNERRIRRFKRLSEGSVDPENRTRYASKLEAWQAEQRRFVKANSDVLKRRYENESALKIGVVDNKDTARAIDSMHKEAARIEDMRAVLGSDKIPGSVDIMEKMPYSKDQMRFVKLDYSRRKRLINNPELKLQNAENAIIDDRKFTEYLFNPDNPRGWAKGQAFAARLGYDQTNWQDLKEEINSKKDKFPVTFKGNNGYADTYEQKQIIYGTKGKPANVTVGWAVDKNGTHMSSAYIERI